MTGVATVTAVVTINDGTLVTPSEEALDLFLELSSDSLVVYLHWQALICNFVERFADGQQDCINLFFYASMPTARSFFGEN